MFKKIKKRHPSYKEYLKDLAKNPYSGELIYSRPEREDYKKRPTKTIKEGKGNE